MARKAEMEQRAVSTIAVWLASLLEWACSDAVLSQSWARLTYVPLSSLCSTESGALQTPAYSSTEATATEALLLA